jgi:hypothetical protein
MSVLVGRPGAQPAGWRLCRPKPGQRRASVPERERPGGRRGQGRHGRRPRVTPGLEGRAWTPGPTARERRDTPSNGTDKDRRDRATANKPRLLPPETKEVVRGQQPRPLNREHAGNYACGCALLRETRALRVRVKSLLCNQCTSVYAIACQVQFLC